MDQVSAAILSDYVYHLADSASSLPTGWVPLTTGAENKPLTQYDAASGDYAEVYTKPLMSSGGVPVLDELGNVVPQEIMTVYRGTVFSSDREDFQSNAAGKRLADTAASQNNALSDDDAARTTYTDIQIVLGQENQQSQGSTISAVIGMDQSIKSSIVAEFGESISAIPYLNAGQSLGGMNAQIATAYALQASDGWNVSAVAFNSPPVGVMISSSGLYSPGLDSVVRNFYAGNEVITDSYVTRALIFIGQEVGSLLQGAVAAPFEIGSYVNLPGDIDYSSLLSSFWSTLIQAHDPKSALAGVVDSVQAAGETSDGIAFSTVLSTLRSSYAGVPLSLTPQLNSFRNGTDSAGNVTEDLDNSDASSFIQTGQTVLAQLPSLIAGTTDSGVRAYYQSLQSALQDTTGGYYVVQVGDTWATLATRYGVSAATLQALNVGNDPSGFTGPDLIIRTPISVTNGVPGAPQLNPSIGETSFLDVSTGKWIVELQSIAGTDAGQVEIIDDTGSVFADVDGSLISSMSFANGNWSARLNGGGVLYVYDGGTTGYAAGGTGYSFGLDRINIDSTGLLQVQNTSSVGEIGLHYNFGASGSLTEETTEFVAKGQSTTPTISQGGSATISLESTLAADVPSESESSTPIYDQYFNAAVASGPAQAQTDDMGADTLPGGQVVEGTLLNKGGISITTAENAAGTDSIANSNGLVDSSLSGVIDGYTRPGNGQDQPMADIVGDLISGQETGGSLSNPAPTPEYQISHSSAPVLDVQEEIDLALADYAFDAPDFIDIDPLLVDLTGTGITLTNWLGNSVFFDTNLNSAGTAADGMEHHTSWMASGTGMLVFDPTGGAITNIAQTVSESIRNQVFV